MYAPAWMRAPFPIVVSFSISEPRPRTQLSPIETRSRMHDWSPTIESAPTDEPAKTIAPVETTTRAPISAGGSGSRLAVDDRASEGCLPTTAYSSTRTSSPSTVPGYTVAVGWISAGKRPRQHLERTDDARAVTCHLFAVATPFDQLQKVAALQAQRLVGRDLGYEDVARAGLPLAVGFRALPRRLFVDRHLALE